MYLITTVLCLLVLLEQSRHILNIRAKIHTSQLGKIHHPSFLKPRNYQTETLLLVTAAEEPRRGTLATELARQTLTLTRMSRTWRPLGQDIHMRILERALALNLGNKSSVARVEIRPHVQWPLQESTENIRALIGHATSMAPTVHSSEPPENREKCVIDKSAQGSAAASYGMGISSNFITNRPCL